VPLDGGARTKITSMTGSNQAEVSPDESTLGLVYSYSTKPPEVYVMAEQRWRRRDAGDDDADRGVAIVQLDRSEGDHVQGARRRRRLRAAVHAGDDRRQARSARPGVVFVHGAGYAQNAHKYWASYFREYMFHNLLASRGYVVLDVDYRASSGYGRDWRTAIYRHMGGKDSRTSSTARSILPRRSRSTRSTSASTAAATADSSR
jgi:dipeptidyl aminopeptidase/acylaminoacyl peptidase